MFGKKKAKETAKPTISKELEEIIRKAKNQERLTNDEQAQFNAWEEANRDEWEAKFTRS